MLVMENNTNCYSCNSFFCDKKDFETRFGVCLRNVDEFEPYIESICEESDFYSCMNLYDNKRFAGERTACSEFEKIETEEFDTDEIDISEMDEKEIFAIVQLNMKNRNIDDVIEKLKSRSLIEKENAISTLNSFIAMGNKSALDCLLEYFITSPAAETIAEVHTRVRIIDILRIREDEKVMIPVFIDELCKTPSNNTTRKIYTDIFKFFEHCSLEIIKEPLLNYVKDNCCSYRIKQRIIGIIDDRY